MKSWLSFCLLCALTTVASMPAQADSTNDLLKEAIGLLEQDNYTEAREVVAIALDQIDHHLLDTTAANFPAQIGAFTRGKVNTEKAMGMDMTECTYSDKQDHDVQVQLMGGGGGMMGGLAALGASFGGGRKVRIQGHTGTMIEDEGEFTLTLKMKSGKSLIITSSSLDGEGVNNFAEAFPVNAIDTVNESGY